MTVAMRGQYQPCDDLSRDQQSGIARLTSRDVSQICEVFIVNHVSVVTILCPPCVQVCQISNELLVLMLAILHHTT